MSTATVSVDNHTASASAMALQLLAHFEAFGTFGDLYGYSKDELDALYAVGHARYRLGKYQEAHTIFAFLVQQDHFERRYLHALAGSLHMLGNYPEAIKFYGLVLGYDIDDPSVIVPLAECFARIGRRDAAVECLNALVELDTTSPQNPVLMKRANALRSLLISK